MRNRRLTPRHTLWKCGIQNYKMKREQLEATPLVDLFTVPTDDSRQQCADHCSGRAAGTPA
eukprot:6802621-Pyramimonas_sp.AAC.1